MSSISQAMCAFFSSRKAVPVLLGLTIIGSVEVAHADEVITAFNFNNNTSQTTLLTSTSGQPTTILTNFSSANVLLTLTGSTVNAINNDPAGTAVAFQNQAENTHYAQLAVDTTGISGISVSFATQRTGTGFGSAATPDQIFYSTTGVSGTYTQFATYTPATSFAKQTFDFSNVSGLNNNPNAAFQIVFNGASSANGNNRIDNFIVSTSMPEPGSLALIGFSALAFVGQVVRRRRAA